MAIYIPDLIISGGQTGSDFGALIGAKKCGIPTGGFAPKGYRTESGYMPELEKVYGLVECESPEYRVRTLKNVLFADAVLLICRDFGSVGSDLTVKLCFDHAKPLYKLVFAHKPSFMPRDWESTLILWLNTLRPGILMVAGNRESKAPGIGKFTEGVIGGLFSEEEHSV